MESERKQYHHGSLREACISEGLRLLEEREGGEFSLRDIAKSLGVSHGAPYNHFKSKDELMAAIAEQGFRLFSKALAQAGSLARDDAEFFTGMGRAYFSFANNHPHHYRLMFLKEHKNREQTPTLMEAANESFGHLINMVEGLKAKGFFADRDTMVIAMTIWSMVHGYSSLSINGLLDRKTEQPEEITQLFEGMHEILIKGLK